MRDGFQRLRVCDWRKIRFRAARRIAMPETIYEEIIGEVKADYDIRSACYALQTLLRFPKKIMI